MQKLSGESNISNAEQVPDFMPTGGSFRASEYERLSDASNIREALVIAQQTGDPVEILVYTSNRGWHTRRVRIVGFANSTEANVHVRAIDLAYAAEAGSENQAFRTFLLDNIERVTLAA
jgi:hypothetical protein